MNYAHWELPMSATSVRSDQAGARSSGHAPRHASSHAAVVFACLAWLAAAGVGGDGLVETLHAQGTVARALDALRVPAAAAVVVRLRGGAELSGTFVSAAPDHLRLDLPSGERRVVPADMVVSVWRRGDRLVNGAVIGGLVGLAGGLLGQSGCTNCGNERAVGVVVGVPLWAGVGAWIDARHRGRTLVYEAPDR